MIAGQGNDLIFGNQGNDTLTGNLGGDTFKFNSADGADLITDFSLGQGDKIDLQGLGHTVSQASDGSALVNVFGGGTVELAGIAAINVNDTFFT